MGTRLALSLRQPHAEQILSGVKVHEYRSRATRVRGRVYIYATRRVDGPGRDGLVTGKIVGTVEIAACEWDRHRKCYRWLLARPKRVAPRAPRKQPQPVWFYPF